uniref:Uncharacterized protein n=1 Tax=Panagrolaimus sp. JU765 TaxID=591449 RepID=A0AC34Q0V7_9BILA
MNMTKQIFRLFLVAVMISCILASSIQFRVRPDKKAMRNSLVRFGKRANIPEKSFDEEPVVEPRFLDNGGYILPERFFFQRFQEYN